MNERKKGRKSERERERERMSRKGEKREKTTWVLNEDHMQAFIGTSIIF